ncbi:MAG: VanZ family protein [Anaerotardibacter sp.]
MMKNTPIRNNEDKFRLLLLGVLLLAWAVVIFAFSANTGEESQGMSDGFIVCLLETLVPDYSGWAVVKQLEIQQLLSYPIRKTAHFLEYAVFGILAYFFFVQLTKVVSVKSGNKPTPFSFKKSVLAAAALSVMYASFDEFHQLFVGGRSGQFSDVIIDSFGAVFGIALVSLVCFLRIRHTHKRNQ